MDKRIRRCFHLCSLFVMFIPALLSAETFRGTINITVGETYYVSHGYETGYTVTGGWSRTDGTAFRITSSSSGSGGCTIVGNSVGTSKLRWMGVVAGGWSVWDENCYWTVNVTAAPVKVTNIQISSASETLKVNDTFQLTATVLPNNASNKSVTWSSDNTTVATVSTFGLVTAKSYGTAKITCKANDGSGKLAMCMVTVQKTKVKEIILNSSSVLLDKGKTKQLTATISPSDADDKSVTWTSSNATVATVSSSGLVTAKSYGTATITCKANDGSGVTAKCTVDIHGPLVAEINATNFPDANFRNYLLSQTYGSDGKLTEDELKDITEINVSEKDISSLKGIEYFTALSELYCGSNKLASLDVSKNTALTSLDCSYNQLTSLDVSKNTALTSLDCHHNQLTSLDVSNNVALKFLQCGSNRLYTLDVSNNSILSELTCGGNQLTSITLPQSITLKCLAIPGNRIKGGAMDAIIKALPTNTTPTEYELLVINLDDGNKGNVFTKAQAEAAKAKGWTPKCWSETEKKWLEYEGSDGILVENITLNNSSVTLEESKTHQLTATVTPSNATDKSVTWSSSNISVATVSSSGLVTAKSAGTATITCKANDGSGKSASCKVTVESTPNNPDIYITSIQSGNADLTSLTKKDKLSLTATFMNYGATVTVSTRLWIFDQNMETVAYSDYQSYPFNADSETTVSMDYALTDIPAGKYFASILYYDEWEMNTWLYTPKYLVDIEIVDPSPINKGDVNEDEKVNGTDLVALTNIILGKNVQKTSADVNGDGKVNGTDYVALANIILGKTAASRLLDDRVAVGGTATLQVEPLTIRAGETRELTVSLTNPDDELTLLQFDLLLPEGLYINKVGDDPCVSMGSRTSEHSHQLSTYADGQRVRCLLASPGNELVDGKEGAVVRMAVTASNDFNGSTLQLKNILGVTPTAEEVFMPPTIYAIAGSDVTGVGHVNAVDAGTSVYNLSGNKVSQPQKGLNIINGKKSLLK